jgi:hypothetical protein
MGVQLAALLAAGVGAEWFGRMVWETITPAPDSTRPPSAGIGTTPLALLERASPLRFLIAGAALVLGLAPAWSQAATIDDRDARAIETQRAADATHGREIDRLLAMAAGLGPGRIYAGMPSNWGSHFQVGAVPVFKYLARENADEVGFTLRTASLMTDPEYYFDEANPSDFSLFGVRYLILPQHRSPPITARRVGSVGPYALWTTQQSGYARVGTLVGSVDANREDVGIRSVRLLRSNLAARGGYLRVRWGSNGRAEDIGTPPPRLPGAVLVEHDELSRGRVSVVVRFVRAGLLVLSSSFDPSWRVSVDGVSRPTIMVAPALVGVSVPTGIHRIDFAFRDSADYFPLFVFALMPLVLLLLAYTHRYWPWPGYWRGCRAPRS